MRIGYETITWRMDIEQAFRDISSVGFPGVEIAGMHAVGVRDDILSLLHENSLSLIAAYVGGSYIDDEYYNDYELPHFKEVCHFLQSSGSASHVVIAGGMKRPEGNTREDYEVMASALNTMGKYATECGLQPCYHPHRGTMVEFPDQIRDIANLTDAKYVKFCFDIAHLVSGGGDPARLCREFSDRLIYIHLKDIDDRNRFVELGEGRINIKEVWDVLRKINFDGPLVVEVDSSDNPRESCKRNKEFLESLGIVV